jgi:hypothetical protein
MSPQRYIEKMVDSYKQMFNEINCPKPSPLDCNGHLETDMTEFLCEEGIQMYQCLLV